MFDLIEETDLRSLIIEAANAAKMDLGSGFHRLAMMVGACVISERGGAASVEAIAAEWSRFNELKALSVGALALRTLAPVLELNTDREVRLVG
jgi:hypothetical protein